MKRIAIQTLGCKINQYESACIADQFLREGYVLVDFDQDADIYVINSCTVTNRTDFKSRNAIRKAVARKTETPNTTIIVTGCYAQRNPDDIKALGGVDFIIDNQSKGDILSIIEEHAYQFQDILSVKDFAEMGTDSMLERSRAFLKIQDGCDFYCAYCAVPYARGHSRSRLPENVLEQVKRLVNQGFQEFVLGGVNLGLYGLDNGQGYNLSNLLYDIEAIEGVKKIRLSSIEPQLFTDDLLGYIRSSKKLCPHFHIPLQSGSDTILQDMGRHYRTKEFALLIDKLCILRPDSAIGIDVIVGFPGETDELFNETMGFIESISITYLHVFTYSKRKGTKAASLPKQINGILSTERSRKLINIGQQKLSLYMQRLIDNQTIISGVIENTDNGIATCLSDHFVRIYSNDSALVKGNIYQFRAISLHEDGVLGVRV